MAKTGDPGWNDRDVSKLPKWAQTELNRLKNDLTATQEALETALGKVQSPIEIDPYFGDYSSEKTKRPRAYIPARECIRFRLNDDQYIDVTLRDHGLHVSGGSIGSGDELVIRPQASNLFHVNFAPRFRLDI